MVRTTAEQAERDLMMEFHEKLLELRKRKGLTQEELAEALFISRAAVSKWESGRGYPNIDSLKAIAAFFSVTIDDLLSSGEVLALAEENHKRSALRFRDLVLGLLDCSIAMILFLPFFGESANGTIHEVSLLSLTEAALWLKTMYLAVVTGTVLWGILTLALQNTDAKLWLQQKTTVSLLLSSSSVLLFIISRQPYAAVLAFVFLLIKGFVLIKQP